MKNWISVVALSAILNTTSCAAPPECENAQSFEQEFVVHSGSEAIQFVHPFIFREGTSILFGTNNAGYLTYCLTVNDIENCAETSEPPNVIWGVDLVPFCQADEFVLRFEVVRESADPIFVYYVDGSATHSRDEATRWVDGIQNCNIDW